MKDVGVRIMIKKTHILILIFVLGILLIFCSKEDKDEEFFKIRVDNVEYPESIARGDTITFRLFGTIGTNGCYSFSHFEESKGELFVELTVWGKRTQAYVCTEVMVYLNKEYSVLADKRGTFILRINQPDGKVLNCPVNVE